MMQRVLDQWQQMGAGSASEVSQHGKDVQATAHEIGSKVSGLAKGKLVGGLSLGKAIVAAVVIAGVSAAVWVGVKSDNVVTPFRQNGVDATAQPNAANASPEKNEKINGGEMEVGSNAESMNATASKERNNLQGDPLMANVASHGKLNEKLDFPVSGSGKNAVEAKGVETAEDKVAAVDAVQKVANKTTSVSPKLVVVSKPLEVEISVSDKAYVVRVEKRWEDSGEVRIDWGLGQGFTVQRSKEIFVQRTVKLKVLVQVVRIGKVVKSGEEMLVVEPHGDAAEILVPEIITRNGDGLNDDFYVSMPQPEYFEIMIMDKSNRVVYRSNDWDAKWNGLKSGIKVESGEYAVMLAYRYSNQKKLNYVRQILIIQD